MGLMGSSEASHPSCSPKARLDRAVEEQNVLRSCLQGISHEEKRDIPSHSPFTESSESMMLNED
jgi:hypothetical protein